MDKLIIRIDLFQLVKLKQENKTIGIWTNTESTTNSNHLYTILKPPMIINTVEISDKYKSECNNYDVTVAAIHSSLDPGSEYRPTEGSDIFRFTHYKDNDEELMFRETGWAHK